MCKPTNFKSESIQSALSNAIFENFSARNLIADIFNGNIEFSKEDLRHAFEHLKASVEYIRQAERLNNEQR